jgi:hypothetical protein
MNHASAGALITLRYSTATTQCMAWGGFAWIAWFEAHAWLDHVKLTGPIMQLIMQLS